MTSTSALLLEHDQRRPRSRQREFGMSDLGGCRRRAGYILDGTERSNASASVQAALGTAIHDAVARVLAEVAEPGDLVEHEVRFAGILGHFDRYEAKTATVVDVKTTSTWQLKRYKDEGAPRRHRWQSHSYGAALISAGHRVRHIRIDYLARDTGEEWSYTEPFDPLQVRDALQWVAEVRAVPTEMLPRDFMPDSVICQGCPFRDTCWEGAVAGRQPLSVLYVEDPDAQRWARELVDARTVKKEAEEREKRARGALDALRPDDGGSIDVGDGITVEYSLSWPERLDSKAVRDNYAQGVRAGSEPPTKASDGPEVRVTVRINVVEPVSAAS